MDGGAALYGCNLYFFADRYAVNGDAAIGFWLFKSNVSLGSGGKFNGTHTVGDLLLISNFTNGGGAAEITAYEWVGTGGDQKGGTLQSITLTSANYFATVNTTEVDSPWPYQPKDGTTNKFPAGAFFEGGVNLCSLAGIDGCFTSFMLETRVSQEITATLETSY
ncbi:hypothetical protein [Hymenobacter radiodurans]|uniref:hypothetical protein n=1 Tax=Hymenobacter radiodurans TaxID=2496028 RepID=UPI001058803B|nr:hypothetical protein [Hymenobacter radiodurans]